MKKLREQDDVDGRMGGVAYLSASGVGVSSG
jgi:hypothetical protein